MILNTDEFSKFANSLADDASKTSMRYFRNKIEIEIKDDESPVTLADKETERVLREKIRKEYTDHVMLGEYEMPFSDESIDLIVCGQTLEHVNNPFKTVEEMKRILKTGHYMCLCAPSAGPKHDNPDVWRFMDDAFKAIAKDVGGLKIIMDWVYRTGNDIDRGKKWQDHTCVMQKIS